MKKTPLFIVLFAILSIVTAVVLSNMSFAGIAVSENGQDMPAQQFDASVVEEEYSEVQPLVDDHIAFNDFINQKYKKAGLKEKGLDKKVFERAMIGFHQLKAEGKLAEDKSIISIVDFSKKSTKKRLWVVDLKTNKVLFNSLIAHGRNTGEQFAKCFSNQCNSNMSSLGFYVTAETYIGKHGLSLMIDGMEKGFNDNARQRSVVIHGADYATNDFAKRVGRLGRSLGCPAVPTAIAPKVINTIKEGTCLFIYYPDSKYEKQSKYQNFSLAQQYYNDNHRQLAQK